MIKEAQHTISQTLTLVLELGTLHGLQMTLSPSPEGNGNGIHKQNKERLPANPNKIFRLREDMGLTPLLPLSVWPNVDLMLALIPSPAWAFMLIQIDGFD
ncbi:hypothetical protein NC653_009973 [Populus alba x Populus x berolinensis]|uniref:Uncharacterized protein n=1 Tax=Populus alba x Populus x berolinensis TaxID=444605 RepID=A0AAD6WCB2_9ROSI|nr:hypothetical protein NC653_009973 [Populus alba x Populus x berolinensis]